MEEKLNLSNDGMILSLDNIQEAFQNVYNHYRSLYNRNKYLEEENERLKSESYRDEELSKLKEEYNKLKEDYNRGFHITKKEQEKINKWIEGQEKKHKLFRGTIGGRYYYKFYPTSIGVSGIIVDSVTDDMFNFKELD